MYSKSEQWDRLTVDFGSLENDEELLITIGDRQYTVRVADSKAKGGNP